MASNCSFQGRHITLRRLLLRVEEENRVEAECGPTVESESGPNEELESGPIEELEWVEWGGEPNGLWIGLELKEFAVFSPSLEESRDGLWT
jgi:hypothetical protein